MGNVKMEVLDCTLRDGAYIVDAKFGNAAIKGIISKLQNAGVEIIECGWLKNAEHISGTTFYHTPNDVKQYIIEKSKDSIYAVMIDWDRYDLSYLPDCDGKSIDAVRVVFPCDKFKEGIAVGREIKNRGYKVYFQAANTLAYSDDELIELSKEVNRVSPEAISIVDTFGAMYEEDLDRILRILNQYLDKEIGIGFHSHNNQQMAFANSIYCARTLSEISDRKIILDSSLSGMGRGAGNTPTELVVNYLNEKFSHNYDIDDILDAIDTYMTGFQGKYIWGYTTPYCIAGMYCCHVNNISYLQNNYRVKSKDLRNIIESLAPEERKRYNYDTLENKYLENQNRTIDDKKAMKSLRDELGSKREGKQQILFIAPGKSSLEYKNKIEEYIRDKKPIVIGINALLNEYKYDYLFLANAGRYDYAKTTHKEIFDSLDKIILSNIMNVGDDREYIVNYSRAIKRGWPHFDNAVICGLRLMDRIGVKNVALAGFDGFKSAYNESYADDLLPTINPECSWDDLNCEIREMFIDVKKTTRLNIEFLTESLFDVN